MKLVKMGIRTSTDFQLLCAGRLKDYDKRPADLPSNPLMYYDQVSSFEELIALGDKLLSTQSKSDKSATNIDENIMSYEQLKGLVREFRICSIRQWKAAVKEQILPGCYPTAPHLYYDEFESWPEFLAAKSSRFLDYTQARKVAMDLAKEYRLKTAFDWRWLSRERLRPKNLPSAPDNYYEEFVSWKHFYGLD